MGGGGRGRGAWIQNFSTSLMIELELRNLVRIIIVSQLDVNLKKYVECGYPYLGW